MAICLRCIYTRFRKGKWLVISTAVSKIKDFSRSQPVTYTVNVVIRRKRYQIRVVVTTDH